MTDIEERQSIGYKRCAECGCEWLAREDPTLPCPKCSMHKVPKRSMNASEVSIALKNLDNWGPPYGYNQNDAIGFVFRCDMTTARNIVNRIGEKLGIGNDPIVVLKTADALTICQCALQELDAPPPNPPK